MKKIEKIIWLFLVMVLLNSCSNESEEVSNKSGIHFNISNIVTRGTPINTSSAIPNLVLYGYYTGRGSSNNWSSTGSVSTPNFVNGKVIVNNSGVWSNSEPIYWPQASDANISFFSYSPASTANNGVSVNGTNGVPSLNYTVPTDVTSQPDLMVAIPHYDLNRSNGNNVSFTMNHALTSVGFRIAGSGETVTGVKISGVRTTGTLSMNGASIIWSNLGSITTTEFNAGVNTTSASATMTSLMQGNGYLMMIPQTLDSNAKITLTLSDNSTREISLSGTSSWEAGKTVYYNITFASTSGTVTVTPSTLLLPWTSVDHTSGNIAVSCQDDSGNESPTTAWTLTSNDPWLKLSLSQNDASGAVQTLSGRGSQTVYTYATANTSSINRSTTISLEGNTVVDVTQIGTQPVPEGSVGTLFYSSYPYVGAFWKASQKGERVIKMKRVASSDEGAWMATVYWKDANWSDNDIVFDNNLASGNTLYTSSPGDAESYQVTNGTSFASGFVKGGEDLIFRIGLNSVLASSGSKPRYATVVLSYANGTKAQLLFLRQGEAADYLMRPNDPVNSGGMVSSTRPLAARFAVYNLTDPSGTFNRNIGVRGGGFTDYPTQTGAIFQFMNNNTRACYAWAPWGTVTGWTQANYTTELWNTLSLTNETCPIGYRRPNDGSTSAYNTTAKVVGSEIRQSLFLNPQEARGIVTGNSVFGYYADGFFDRYEKDAVHLVETEGPNLAARGLLFFNPTTKASLFFPSSLSRFWTGEIGSVSDGLYWTSAMEKVNYGYYLVMSKSNASLMTSHSINYGFSIRPVAE